MTMRLDMMRCFRATVRGGTLAAAADALGRTPSAISMTLSQFEAEVGAPLFAGDRKNRLTPLGLRILEECDRALEAYDRSRDAITRHARSTAGTVRIAAVPSAALTILPAAMTLFRRTSPDVRLEVSDLDSEAVLRKLQFDEADIGIASIEEGQGAPAAEIVGEHLLTDRLGIVCRRDSPILDAPRGWASLRREPLIGNPLCAMVDHPDMRDLLDAGTLHVRNTMTLLAFVRSGLGATILPHRVMLHGAEDLAFTLPDDPAVSRNLIAMTHRSRPPSPAATAFLESLDEIACQEKAQLLQNMCDRY